jgi:hypothetical protein
MLQEHLQHIGHGSEPDVTAVKEAAKLKRAFTYL